MKTRSKALLLMLCAVSLVTASVLGTMAYLTSTAEVKNTFAVGSVSITMDEEDVDNDSDTSDNVTVDGVVRDKANSYKLMPGHTYTKDPIIHVGSGSEDCYLFVKVVDEISEIEADTTVAAQMADMGWVKVDGTENVYVYTIDKQNPAVVTASADVTVFESFTVRGDVTGSVLEGYKDKTITVTAYAVQKDGFETKTASQIWDTAFPGK